MPDYASTTYDTTKATIRNYRTNHWEWKDILWLSQTDHSDNSRDNSLATLRGNGSVKNDVTADDWCQLVELMKAEEEARGTIILVPPEGRQELIPLSPDPRTCWRQYAAKLRNKGFSEGVVAELEKSCQTVAQGFLAKGDNAVEKNATRGMVIGSVQSGKTMHMAGVIAQAADLGFNYFIILTGIIDNLRKQTEKRDPRHIPHGTVQQAPRQGLDRCERQRNRLFRNPQHQTHAKRGEIVEKHSDLRKKKRCSRSEHPKSNSHPRQRNNCNVYEQASGREPSKHHGGYRRTRHPRGKRYSERAENPSRIPVDRQ